MPERVRDVHLSAFETSDETALVSVLRDRATPLISLVAEEAGTIVGHILARELRDGALFGTAGTVRYHPAFAVF